MRNAAHRTVTLDYLRVLWDTQPHLRLGQLLSNAMVLDSDLFYIEDDMLLKRLAETYVPQGGPR